MPSQAFNQTFRSLDNAFQWRSAQKQQQAQFEEQMALKRQQLESMETLRAAQQSLVESQQTGRDLANRFASETFDTRVDTTKAQADNARATADINQSTARKAKATEDQDIATHLAQQKKDELLFQNASRALVGADLNQAREVFSEYSDEELATDPRKLSAFVSTITGIPGFENEQMNVYAGDMVGVAWDESKDSYVTTRFNREEGQWQVEIDEETGRAERLSQEEAAEVVGALREQVDSIASQQGGGSFQERQIRTIAEASVPGVEDARPVDPELAQMPPEQLAEDLAATEAEMAALNQEIRTLESTLAEGSKGRSRGLPQGVRGPDGVMSGASEGLSAEERAELGSRIESLSSQYTNLAEVAQGLDTNLANIQFNTETRPQLIADREARVGNTVRQTRAQRNLGEEINSERIANTAQTGNPHVSGQEAQEAYWEVADPWIEAASEAAVRRTIGEDGMPETIKDPDMKFQLETQLRDFMGSDRGRQLVAAGQSGAVILRTLAQRASRMSGSTRDVNLTAAYDTMFQKASARDVGQVTDHLMKMGPFANRADMSATEHADILQSVAGLLSERGTNDPLSGSEAKAIASRAMLQYQEKRQQRFIKD